MDTNTPLVISSNEDFLALVPYTVGFHVEESVVMLSCRGPRSVNARIDLSRCAEEDAYVAQQLIEAMLDNDVTAVAFVVYSDDTHSAERLTERLMSLCFLAGIAVVTALRVDDGRWFALVDGVVGARPEGVPFDVSTHPITMKGVLEGRVTHRNRAELAASLEPDNEGVAAVERALEQPRRAAAADWAAHRVSDVVRRHCSARSEPDDETVVELLLALADDTVMAEVVCAMEREEAPQRVEFWRGVLRRTPQALLGPVAAMTAMAAWLAGDGALAWCALDRGEVTGRRHPVATMVTEFLDAAIAPDRRHDPEVRRGGPAPVCSMVDPGSA